MAAGLAELTVVWRRVITEAGWVQECILLLTKFTFIVMVRSQVLSMMATEKAGFFGDEQMQRICQII